MFEYTGNEIITQRPEKMHRSNFRVKLDLYRYYKDVRRFCWVFVDGTKILDIAHLKRHITKLFGIEEPFHVLLNKSDYLHPDEDVRILKENELILVLPGTGLDNVDPLVEVSPIKNQSLPEIKDISFTSVEHKEVQAPECTVTQEEQYIFDHNEVSIPMINGYQSNVTENTSFHTLPDETDPETSLYKTIVESDTIEDSSVIDNLVPIPKKKRIRKRKQKSKGQSIEEPNKYKAQAKNQEFKLQNGEEQNETTPQRRMKPKIISTSIIPMGKHIRFDTVENDKMVIDRKSPSPQPNGIICQSKNGIGKLSTLLSLGKNSTPLTFTSNSQKKPMKQQVTDDEALTTSTNATPEKVVKTALQERKEEINATNVVRNIIESFSEADAHQYPIATAKLHEKDVIAFKMLKIGQNYTPQISNYIIAEVLSIAAGKSLYNLKILRGSEEIETPVGKFTLEDETEEAINSGTIALTYTNFIQPRLIYTSEQSELVNPLS